MAVINHKEQEKKKNMNQMADKYQQYSWEKLALERMRKWKGREREWVSSVHQSSAPDAII